MPQRIAENIYRIPVPLPDTPLRELNAYYIKDAAGRGLLVDTGFRLPECREALFAGLRALGAPEDGVDVALTHFHADHAGLALEAAGAKGDIYISGRDSFWLWPERRAAYRAAEVERQIRDGFPAELARGMAQRAAPGEPDGARVRLLHEGRVIERGGYELRCVESPGHTPGHVCFWIEKERIMLCGDAVLFDITPNITSEQSPDPLGDYLDTLKRLSGYDAALALPGHRSGGNLRERAGELAAHHAARLDEAEGIIRAEPGLTPYEVCRRMSWHIRGDGGWDAFPAQQKWFAAGEGRAHVDRLAAAGRVYKAAGEDGLTRCYPRG